MKTETPETDTHQEQMEVEDLDVECSETYHLARKLERERDDARRQHAADVAELNERLAKQQSDMLDTIVELRRESVKMREAIKEAHDALDGCREDTCELIAERDWWKTELRCGYSARWADMQVRLAKADAALAKLQPYLK